MRTSIGSSVSTRSPVALAVYQKGDTTWYDAGLNPVSTSCPESSGHGWTVWSLFSPCPYQCPALFRSYAVLSTSAVAPDSDHVHVVQVGSQGDPQVDGDARQIGGGGDAQGVAVAGAVGDLPDEVPVTADPEPERPRRRGQDGPARPVPW